MASFGKRLEFLGWLAVVIFACVAEGRKEAYGAPNVLFGPPPRPPPFEIFIQDQLYYQKVNTYSLIAALQENVTDNKCRIDVLEENAETSDFENRIAALEGTVVTLQNMIDALVEATVAVNGSYSMWGEWGACSASCGPGMETRFRVCDDPAPSNGGADCMALGEASEAQACEDVPCPGSLRLVNTLAEDNTRGRVEIYFQGEWGTICQDFWSSADAIVACNQLGLPSGDPEALNGAETPYGQGTGMIWLDNILCTGLETRLEDCPNGGVGMTNCDHSKDVGLICMD